MEYRKPADQIYKQLDSQDKIFEERHQRAAQLEEERKEEFLAKQREKGAPEEEQETEES